MSHHSIETTGSTRVPTVDVLRGMVIILMAIDHCRDFFSPAAFFPEEADQTTPALFLTRWITHFCAPVFVFLAGTSVFLYRASGRRDAEVSRFLITRGLWLIAIEFLIVNPSWFIDFYRTAGFFLFAQVIWVIGWSMILLGAMIRLPIGWIIGAGLIIVLGHNALDFVTYDANPVGASPFDAAMLLLHGNGAGRTGLLLPGGIYLAIIYPLLPWPGVMMLGYGFGGLLQASAERRRRACLILGAASLALFGLLRAINVYGDPDPWSVQPGDHTATVMSFFNLEKYPASLQFLLVTLGVPLLLWPALERWRGRLLHTLSIFGRVPMFFYLVHLPVIHLMATLFWSARGRPSGWWNTPAEDHDPNLWLCYGAWLITILLLWPACAWYAGVKRRNPDRWWLRYL